MAVLGAMLLGVGMCLTMVFDYFVLGIVGIVVLLMLIPLTKGIRESTKIIIKEQTI